MINRILIVSLYYERKREQTRTRPGKQTGKQITKHLINKHNKKHGSSQRQPILEIKNKARER